MIIEAIQTLTNIFNVFCCGDALLKATRIAFTGVLNISSCLLLFQPCMVLSETEMVCVMPDLGQEPVKSTPGCDGGDLKYNLDLQDKDGVV